MAELRSVDPATLVPNPHNPRRTPAPKAQDDQLIASIRAIGMVQPPRVAEAEGVLTIVAGHRRVKAALALGLTAIDVLVCDAEEAADAMRSVSENLIRTSMGSVDIWRATQQLESQGWSEQAVADALALPLRTVQRLKLLAHIHPPMLEVMAAGSMPNEDQLRTIAAATAEEQAQVWKKHKPKKGQPVGWHEVARALSKRRMPKSAAKFGDDLAQAYGIAWEEDLFAPAGEDGTYTTNVEGFFAAQQEWLQQNLPEKASILPVNDWGQPELPKKAERVWGKPHKADIAGHCIDSRTGEVVVVHYRMPEEKKPAKGPTGPLGVPEPAAPPTRPRAEITQKGMAMIGQLRTDALQEAVMDAPLDDATLVGLLVLAFAGKNVSVQSASADRFHGRREIAQPLVAGGVLTADTDLIRQAARQTLAAVLSCEDNMTNSGPLAIVAGTAVAASGKLPSMATEEFLACLSKAALEREAAAVGVPPGARGKDTRAAMVKRFEGGRWVHPRALFALTQDELAELAGRVVPTVTPADPPPQEAEEGQAPGAGEPAEALEATANEEGDSSHAETDMMLAAE